MATTAFETEVEAIPDLPQASSVRIRGRVRHREAPALRRLLLEQIDRSRSSRVVLQLSDVAEMDTSGAAVLVEALLRGREMGKRILLCSPSESVMDTFRLAGFEEALGACCPTPAETRRRLLA